VHLGTYSRSRVHAVGALCGNIGACQRRTAEQTADVDALRAALAQTFTAVYVSPFGGLVIEPKAGMHLEGGRWHGTVAVPLPARTTLCGSGVPE
jgi:hypothetical protein